MHFLQGFMSRAGNTHEILFLNRVGQGERFVRSFETAECVLLAFPLYADSMPAVVKSFVETLRPLCGREGNPALAFLVQSGFPEAIHSRAVERYCRKLASRLGSRYLGTVVKGGVEGIQAKPPWMNRKLYGRLFKLGEYFGATRALDETIVARLAEPERYSWPASLLFRFLIRIGVLNFYWNSQLRENGAFEKRFAAPYEKPKR
jgi:NAD(P)H-dependent FMN reductase